jgi:hypothetical protein
VVDDSHCHSFITEKESEQLGSEDEAERNAAAVNIALKYTFDPLRSFYLRGNIRAKGSGPMDAVEWAFNLSQCYTSVGFKIWWQRLMVLGTSNISEDEGKKLVLCINSFTEENV